MSVYYVCWCVVGVEDGEYRVVGSGAAVHAAVLRVPHPLRDGARPLPEHDRVRVHLEDQTFLRAQGKSTHACKPLLAFLKRIFSCRSYPELVRWIFRFGKSHLWLWVCTVCAIDRRSIVLPLKILHAEILGLENGFPSWDKNLWSRKKWFSGCPFRTRDHKSEILFELSFMPKVQSNCMGGLQPLSRSFVHVAWSFVQDYQQMKAFQLFGLRLGLLSFLLRQFHFLRFWHLFWQPAFTYQVMTQVWRGLWHSLIPVPATEKWFRGKKVLCQFKNRFLSAHKEPQLPILVCLNRNNRNNSHFTNFHFLHE